MPFPSRTEYEALVYGITTEFPDVIVSSTLRIYSTAALSSNVEGQVDFANGLILEIWEVIDFRNERFVDYSYDVSYQGEKIRWYDPQPHPEIESLQSTFPPSSTQSAKHQTKSSARARHLFRYAKSPYANSRLHRVARIIAASNRIVFSDALVPISVPLHSAPL